MSKTIVGTAESVRHELEGVTDTKDTLRVKAVEVLDAVVEASDAVKSREELEDTFGAFDTFSDIVEGGKLKEITADHTTNMAGMIDNDLQWTVLEDEAENLYIICEFHLFGDVRANYTDALVLFYEYNPFHPTMYHNFLEAINDQSGGGTVTVDYHVRTGLVDAEEFTREWQVTTLALSEMVMAYHEESGTELEVFGDDWADIKEAIHNKQVPSMYR